MLKIDTIATFNQLGPRSNQEDCVRPAAPQITDYIYVLCDGMGGHGHGEVASAAVADAVYNCLSSLDDGDITPDELQGAVDYAVNVLHRLDIKDDERTMGTTLVVAVVVGDKLLIGHVGDSRAYIFGRDGKIKFRTRDHSLVAEAVANEILTEEEAFLSPYRNRITRAIMADGNEVEVEVDVQPVADGDILMLCSDGVHDCMRDSELEEVFATNDFDEAVKIICDTCDASSPDNNTLIAVKFKSENSENSENSNKFKARVRKFYK